MGNRIAFELNPPRILDVPGAKTTMDTKLKDFHSRIGRLKGLAHGLQFTDSALGEPRLLSVNTAGRVRQLHGDSFEIICNVRTCDHNLNGIIQLIEEARLSGVEGILILWGDQPKFGPPVRGKGSAQIVSELREIGVDQVKLYLAASFPAAREVLERKLEAKPDGIITQPVPSLDALYGALDILKRENTQVITSIFVPSRKNERALDLIGFDWSDYVERPVEFARNVLKETTGILVSSPNDFNAGVSLIEEVRRT